MKRIILGISLIPVLSSLFSSKGDACFSRAGEVYLDEVYRSSAPQPATSPASRVIENSDQSSPVVEKSRDVASSGDLSV